MLKNKKILIIAGIVCLLVCVGIVLAIFGGSGSKAPVTDQPGGETATYTIEVKSASGIALADVGMYIYEDSSLKELVAFISTDDAGKASFTDAVKDTYVAVLDKVPTGYEAEAYYPITGELTQIVLKTGQMTEEVLETLTYKLGDAVLDFSVTAPDGTVYTLAGLFEGKKAVVLNFFYNACQPCMLEFPFLEEAYAEYKDSISVLAMNPYDGDDASVAALQKELGVTFPMVKCGEEWQSIMQLTAYPTTVIIDRFGNICLIHKGSVPDAKTFKDAFAYFTADKYEQKLIEAIGDLKVEEPEGTKENPTDVGGLTTFEVTVEPGKVVYNDLWKVFGMYLTIRNENAYVIYNGKTYYPEKGIVSLKVTAPDTHTPATVGFGNSGKKTETFKVSLSIPGGTFNNPYQLNLGEFDANVSAGNDQGVYYKYVATEDGTLTLQCLSATKGVKYDFTLYNLNSYAQRNLGTDAENDPSGLPTVSVQAKKGQTVLFSVGSLPDETNSYPAASFKFKATFTGHVIKEEEKIPMTDYTVKVLDDAQQPLSNISVVVTVGEEQKAFTTKEGGVATLSLPTGSYKGMIYVPDGYTAEKTEFELTEAAPNVTLTLVTVKQADYTVKVVGPTGEAVENVFVKIGENAWQRTNAEGAVTMLLDKADYAVTIMVPTGYTGDTAHAFAAGATELTIKLGYPLGSQNNPYVVDAYPYETVKLSGQQEIYLDVHYTDEITGLYIYDENAYIRYKETTYGADESGMVYISLEQDGMESPVQLIVGNKGSRASYSIEAEYALGTEMNPDPILSIENIVVNVAQGKEKGYFYTWYTRSEGALTLSCPVVDGVQYDVIMTDAGSGSQVRLSDSTDGTVSMDVAANTMLTIQVVAADANGNPPALETTLTGTFVYPVGSYMNPQVVSNVAQIEVDIAEGNDQGYYYSWTATKTGVFALNCPAVDGVEYDVILTNQNTDDMVWLSDTVLDFASMDVSQGDAVLIQVMVSADADWNFPALKTTLSGGFHELGTLQNPEAMSLNKMWMKKLDAGDADGYCYGYTAEQNGTLTFQLKQKPSKPYDVRLVAGDREALMSESNVDREVTIRVMAGETARVHFYALLDEAAGTYPTITGRLWATFTPDPVDPEGSEPTEPETDPTTQPTTAPTTEPTTQPSVPSGPAEGEYTYSVTVTDIFGAGKANVQVIFLQGGAPVSAVNTDANGVAELYVDELGDYTVELFFTDGEDYYYDKAAAVLTASNRSLTIKIVANVDESDYSDPYILNGNPAYNLYIGGTRVQVGSGKPNFSAECGNNCFFVFSPQTAGTYQITANDPNVELSFWGGSFSYINQQYTSKDAGRNNAITESISGTSVGNTNYVIGVKVEGGTKDVVLNIARIGDPAFSIADQPWSEWRTNLTHTNGWISEVGLKANVAAGVITSYSLDSPVTYLDITAANNTYNLYYDEANGYYRMYQGGPVVLVNLNAAGRFVPLYERVNGNGQYGGSAVNAYFYDTNGAFVRKESYTEYLYECFACVYLDSNSEEGYHPLTKDLMHALKNGFADWWNPDSGNYLEGFATANKEYAWMFACCYIP